MNGIRLSCYDHLRDSQLKRGKALQLHENIVAGKLCCLHVVIGQVAVLIVSHTFLAGAAGAVAALFGSPLYLVKTQQQAQSIIQGVGHQVVQLCIGFLVMMYT